MAIPSNGKRVFPSPVCADVREVRSSKLEAIFSIAHYVKPNRNKFLRGW